MSAVFRPLFLMLASFGADAEDVDAWSLDEGHRRESLLEWNVGPSDWVSPAVERERIVTDRPHVSEATSTVGQGRIQLETGYSLFWDADGGVTRRVHSLPEPLLRVGLFADWFELRLGYNYLIQSSRGGVGPTQWLSGSDDMLVAAKVAVVKQQGWLPDLTLFPQLRIPTGSDGISSDRILTGLNVAYSWAVTELVEIECNTVLSEKGQTGVDPYFEVLQTFNLEYDLGDRWLGFTEYLAFIPSSSVEARFEHYFHCGIQYYVTPLFQIDIHSAVGLNRAADNLAFTGVGFCWKR